MGHSVTPDGRNSVVFRPLIYAAKANFRSIFSDFFAAITLCYGSFLFMIFQLRGNGVLNGVLECILNFNVFNFGDHLFNGSRATMLWD